jgi:hypothetical protein
LELEEYCSVNDESVTRGRNDESMKRGNKHATADSGKKPLFVIFRFAGSMMLLVVKYQDRRVLRPGRRQP